MFNLKDFDTKAAGEKGAELILKNPANWQPLYIDDDGKEYATITLIGADSDQFIKNNKKATAENRDKAGVVDEKKSGLDQLCAATIAVKNLPLDESGTLATVEDMRSIYETYPWVAEQATAFITDRANFIKA